MALRRDEHVKYGTTSLGTMKTPSKDSRTGMRRATITASSGGASIVLRRSFGPIGKSYTTLRAALARGNPAWRQA